ncbi:MAG: hypothetical protein ACYS22_17180, partial [Planctomycetota bacterium]
MSQTMSDEAKKASQAAAAQATTEGGPPIPPKAAGGKKTRKAKKGRGHKLPKQKKAKETQADAVKALVEKGQVGPDGEPVKAATSGRLSLGLQTTERVVDTTERFAGWLGSNWQFVAAAVLLGIALALFVGWRLNASRAHTAEAFAALGELDDRPETPEPAEFSTLLEQYTGTDAESFIRIKLADAHFAKLDKASVEKALSLYKQVEADGEPELARTVAQRAREDAERELAFDVIKADAGDFATGAVEGLKPLPEPEEKKPEEEKPAEKPAEEKPAE